MKDARVLVAPDKFKGSLSAVEVARAIAAGLTEAADVRVHLLPLADGGDGSVRAALDAGFRALPAEVTGPDGNPVPATVAFDGSTAVVEVATTSGLLLLPPAHLAPLTSSSVGFGQAVRAALDAGQRRIVLALGGSASTDGGAGMLSALGVRFLDPTGQAFVPSGGTLREIARVDLSGLVPLDGIELVAASDVQNPLLGPDGAAAVYGPQKGATPEQVRALDAGLAHLVRALDAAGWPGSASAPLPGAGAAGGLGLAALLLGASLVSGADFFLDLLDFDALAADADLVITGEGKLDTQTLSGKLPLVVARRAAAVPVVAVVGHNALTTDRLPEHGIGKVFALSTMTERDSAADPALSADLLREVGRLIGRSLPESVLRS